MSGAPRDHCLPDQLVEAARRAINANRAAGRRIAMAESCTGGLVAAALTEAAGSSDVFEAGFVTYSNNAKTALLGVGADLIATCGAVSIPVARAMAQGALTRTGADVAVAITGIAGPGGGSEHKPVGTVVFGRAIRDRGSEEAAAEQKAFGKDLGRGAVRLQAALFALELLLP